MNPLLIAAIVQALIALAQFIKTLLDEKKKPTAAERRVIEEQLATAKRARRWMLPRVRREADKRIAEVEAYLKSLEK